MFRLCNVLISMCLASVSCLSQLPAGNPAPVSVPVRYSATLNPPPKSVFITPGQFAMLANQTRQVALVDSLGRTLPATWSIDDRTIATIAPNGTITSGMAGHAVVRATYENLSATADLLVYGDTALQPGTVQWSVPALSGNRIINIFPGRLRSDGGPDRFSEEDGPAGHVIRAFSSDGRQLWITHITPRLNSNGTPVQITGERLKVSSDSAADSGRKNGH